MKKNRTVLFGGLIVLAAWLAAYFGIIHSGYMNWGAAQDEIRRALPGDERATVSGFRATRAITIDAPAGKVWAWISQVGIGRGGFYSYDWLENLFLSGIHNAFPAAPSWPERAEGEFVRSFQFGAEKAGTNGWHYEIVEPGRSFYLNPLWGPFAAEPLGPAQTRLLVRSVGGTRGPVAAFLLGVFFDPIHFTMEKRMLTSVKAAAEGRPPFSAPGTVVAFIGFGLAAAAAAGVILTRKRMKIWIAAPLLWAAAVRLLRTEAGRPAPDTPDCSTPRAICLSMHPTPPAPSRARFSSASSSSHGWARPHPRS